MTEPHEPNGAERRRHARFPCEGFAEVIAFHTQIVFRGKIRDISRSGCFVETRARLSLPRLTEVEVRFTIAGLRQSVLARVMDVRPGKGAGFEFLAADPRLGQAFLGFLDRMSAQAPAAP
ncbi:PilZ domain-containing protein [Acidobacteria bacterium AB60]|nr:PilZ domain-containing protein [Acidobacteria bacterium AB60]